MTITSTMAFRAANPCSFPSRTAPCSLWFQTIWLRSL